MPLLYRFIQAGVLSAGMMCYQIRKPADPFTFAYNLFSQDRPNIGKLATTVPLIIAVNNKDPKKVQELLNQGADPNEVDHNGNSAMHHAVNRDNRWCKLAEELLFAGANPNLKNRAGHYPIDYHADDRDNGMQRPDVQRRIDSLMLQSKLAIATTKLEQKLGIKLKF